MSFSYLLWGIILFLLGLILYRAYGNRMLGHFPIFYGYIGFTFIASAVLAVIIAIYGFESVQYFYGFQARNAPVPILQLWVLGDLYRRILGNTKTSRREFSRSVMVVAVVAAPVVWKVLAGEHDYFVSYHAITLVFQVFLCLIIYRAIGKHRGTILGQNFLGILSGVSLMVALQAINFSHVLFLDSSPKIFRFFGQFIYLLALIVFAYTLWDEKSMQRLESPDQKKLNELNTRLQQVLKSLIFHR